MPLHPQPQKIKDQFSVDAAFSCDGFTMEEYRHSVDDLLPLAGESIEMESIQHFEVEGPNGLVPIIVYSPEKIESEGAVIYFPGNGFVYGDIPQGDIESRRLAHVCRCKVIRVITRSAPEFKYPIGLNDAYTGLKWTFAHADELNIDPNKIGICGESSGGNLAAVCAIRARDEGFNLALQALVSPALDLSMNTDSYERYGEGYILDKVGAKWCFDQYVPQDFDPKDPEISPGLQTNLKDLPPTLMTCSEYEVLRDECAAYADKLKEAGVDVMYSIYEGQMHSYVLFRGEYDQEDDPFDEVGEFVKKKFNES